MSKSPTVRMIEMEHGNVPFEQLAKQAFAQGLSVRQFAQQVGVSYRLVYRWTERLGIQSPGHKVRPRRPRCPSCHRPLPKPTEKTLVTTN